MMKIILIILSMIFCLINISAYTNTLNSFRLTNGDTNINRYADDDLSCYPNKDAVDILFNINEYKRLPFIIGGTYYNNSKNKWLKWWKKLRPHYKYIPLKFKYFLTFNEKTLKLKTRVIFTFFYLHMQICNKYKSQLTKKRIKNLLKTNDLRSIYLYGQFEGINFNDFDSFIAVTYQSVLDHRVRKKIKTKFGHKQNSRDLKYYYLAAYDYSNRLRGVRYIYYDKNYRNNKKKASRFQGDTIYTWNIYYHKNGKLKNISKHDANGRLIYNRIIK